MEQAASLWLDDATAAAKWLGSSATAGRLVAVTRGALTVDAPARTPADALGLGVVMVGRREYAGLSTLLIDSDPERDLDVTALVDEVESATGVIAVRDGRRLTPHLQLGPPAEIAPVEAFRHGGTYLITGALGGIGEELAVHLATRHAANLVLVSSEPIPPAAERERFLRSHAFDHPTCRRVRRVARIEQLGVKVEVLHADLDDPLAIPSLLDEAERRVGRLDGVVHAAGRLRDRLIETAEPGDMAAVVAPKAGAALALVPELQRRGIDLLVLISSTSAALAPEGQAAYVAANSVLDMLAGHRGSLRIVTLNFGVWSGTGMATEAARRLRLGLGDGEPFDHPVLGEMSTDHQGRVVVSGRLSPGHHWVVDEHRASSGLAVLPGTGLLELFLAAARAAGVEPVRLADVVVDRTAHRSRRSHGDGACRRRTRRRMAIAAFGSTATSGLGATWTTHSEASIVQRGRPTLAARPAGDRRPLPARRRRSHGQRSRAPAHLRSLADAGLAARSGDGEVVGRIDDIDDDGELGWLAHPAVTDLATGCAISLTATGGRGPVARPDRVQRGPLVGQRPVAVRRPCRSPRELVRRTAARRHRDRRRRGTGGDVHRRAPAPPGRR